MNRQDVLTVKSGSGRYDVVIYRGQLDHLGAFLKAKAAARKAAIIADENVACIYLDRAVRSLQAAGIEPLALTIPPGEQHKSQTALASIYDRLLPAGIERATPVIGLGGGMTTDLAGFAAATLLRGLSFIPVPTSLLAMVDASIGGKTGVNHAAGKNLIGAFYQPRAVMIDPNVLATLPPRELRSGMAEVTKHYMIRDAAGFARLESNIAAALEPDIDLMTQIIVENVAIKARIIEADPFEEGVRAHLNFGHTFGHAFEHASSYSLSHGEAVSLGMCAAAHAAVELKMLDEASRSRLINLLTSAGLSTRTKAMDTKSVLAAMGRDKKIAHARWRLVLPERIGSVVIRDDVPEPIIRSAIDAIIG